MSKQVGTITGITSGKTFTNEPIATVTVTMREHEARAYRLGEEVAFDLGPFDREELARLRAATPDTRGNAGHVDLADPNLTVAAVVADLIATRDDLTSVRKAAAGLQAYVQRLDAEARDAGLTVSAMREAMFATGDDEVSFGRVVELARQCARAMAREEVACMTRVAIRNKA